MSIAGRCCCRQAQRTTVYARWVRYVGIAKLRAALAAAAALARCLHMQRQPSGTGQFGTQQQLTTVATVAGVGGAA